MDYIPVIERRNFVALDKVINEEKKYPWKWRRVQWQRHVRPKMKRI
jgi:histidinol phosphatase-like enzyme